MGLNSISLSPRFLILPLCPMLTLMLFVYWLFQKGLPPEPDAVIPSAQPLATKLLATLVTMSLAP